MTTLLGIDGCRGGWVVASTNTKLRSPVDFQVVSNIEVALETGGASSIIAIDIPSYAKTAPKSDCPIFSGSQPVREGLYFRKLGPSTPDDIKS